MKRIIIPEGDDAILHDFLIALKKRKVRLARCIVNPVTSVDNESLKKAIIESYEKELERLRSYINKIEKLAYDPEIDEVIL